MNDYHLDPPEEYELPECCSVEMDCDEDGNLKCLVCGKTFEAAADIEPMEEWKCDDCGETYPCKCEDQPDESEHCPHGNKWGDCGTCDHLGDLALDAARETRHFGR